MNEEDCGKMSKDINKYGTKEEKIRYFLEKGPEWMAKQSVGFADHYQAVAKTTGLRLISKEILAKRGLLSCVDYYLLG